MRTIFDLICYVGDDYAVKFKHLLIIRIMITISLTNMIQAFLKTESETEAYLP